LDDVVERSAILLRGRFGGDFRMNAKYAMFSLLWILPLPLLAQAPAVITMDQEPHHHLALHNDYVKVFNVEVASGDSIVLHRHDQDTVAIAIGDQLVTVGVPGKPDVHQKNPDGQLRLQASGYVHSTHVNGGAYHTIAVELLRPQTGARNLCAPVLAGDRAKTSSSTVLKQPQYESGQTRIDLVRVLPHQKMDIAQTAASHLIVALDPASISHKTSKEPDHVLRPGDFMWFDAGDPGHVFENHNDKEVRFIDLAFARIR
jgi:quercetin dioxygenase-like cupin family protein